MLASIMIMVLGQSTNVDVWLVTVLFGTTYFVRNVETSNALSILIDPTSFATKSTAAGCKPAHKSNQTEPNPARLPRWIRSHLLVLAAEMTIGTGGPGLPVWRNGKVQTRTIEQGTTGSMASWGGRACRWLVACTSHAKSSKNICAQSLPIKIEYAMKVGETSMHCPPVPCLYTCTFYNLLGPSFINIRDAVSG